MKTIRIFLFFILGAGLLFACSSDELNDELSDNDLKCRNLRERVVVVEPTGLDDTENLITAFAEAMGYYPHAVVQLVEGEYFIGFIEIREFNGKFRGAGRNKTVITAHNDLDIVPLTDQNLNTYLIKFVGGDVSVSDMTLMTPSGLLTTSDGEWWIEGLLSFAARNRVYTSKRDKITASVNNVEFIGGGGEYGYRSNCNLGVTVGFDSRFVPMAGGWSLSPSDISITNCTFKNFDIYGVLIAYVNGGKVIAGTRNNGNKFLQNSTYDYGYGGSISMWHNNDMIISIVDNSFSDPAGSRFGIEITNHPWLDFLQPVTQNRASYCCIDRNTFNINGGTGGVLVNDARRHFGSDVIPMIVHVLRNNFIQSEEAFTAIGCFHMYGMLISGNKFSGSGSYGVRIMSNLPVYNEKGLMLGNSFQNTDYSIATVLLAPETRNWTLIGSNLGEGVIDEGENNLIKNMVLRQHKWDSGMLTNDDLSGIPVRRDQLKSNSDRR